MHTLYQVVRNPSFLPQPRTILGDVIFASAFLSEYLSSCLFMFFCGLRVCLSYMHLFHEFSLTLRSDAKRSDLPKVEFIREWREIFVVFRSRHKLLSPMVTCCNTSWCLHSGVLKVYSSHNIWFLPQWPAASAGTIALGALMEAV